MTMCNNAIYAVAHKFGLLCIDLEAVSRPTRIPWLSKEICRQGSQVAFFSTDYWFQ